MAAVLLACAEAQDAPAKAPKPRLLKVGQKFEAVFEVKPLNLAYELKAPGEGVIRLRQSQESKLHGWLWPFWTRDGQTVRAGEWDMPCHKGDLVSFSLRSSQNDWNCAAGPEKVGMQVEFEPYLTPEEPNDTLEQAREVKLGESFKLQFNPRYDVDCYKVQAPDDGVLRLRQSQESKVHGWAWPVWIRDGKDERAGEWDRTCSKGEWVQLKLTSSQNHWNHVGSDEVLEMSIVFQPPKTDEEPNNTVEQAKELKAGDVFELQFNPRYDIDYYKVQAPGLGVLRLSQLKESKAHGWAWPWWMRDGKAERAGEWDRGCVKDEWVVFGLSSSQNHWNHVGSDEVVTLRLSFEPLATGEEPNDEAEKARLIQAGQPFELQLNPRYDVDYFKLQAPGDGVMRLTQKKESKAHGWVWPWWRKDGKDDRVGLWDRQCSRGEWVVLGVSSSQNAWNHVGSAEKVELQVNFEAQTTPEEPNNTPATAKEIRIGQPFKLQLNPRHDHDHFRFTSPGNGTMRLHQSQESKAHGWVYPWWLEGDRLIRDGQFDCAVRKGQELVLGVRSSQHGWNEVSSAEVIELNLLFSPEKSVGEPNNTPETAEDLGLEEVRELTFSPRHDHDYFRVRTEKAGILRVRRQDDSPAHRGMTIWWDGAAEEARDTGMWTQRVQAGEPAIFGLRSSLHSWNEVGSDDVIQIRADLLVDPDPSEPNDRALNAVPIELGKPVRLTLFPTQEVDTYELKADLDGAILLKEHSAIHRMATIEWLRAGQDPHQSHWTSCKAGERIVLRLHGRGHGDEPFIQDFTLVSGTEKELGLEPKIPLRSWNFKVEPKQSP